MFGRVVMRLTVVSQSYRLSAPHIALNRRQLREIKEAYAGSSSFKTHEFGNSENYWTLESSDGARVYISSDGQLSFAEKFTAEHATSDKTVAITMLRSWDIIRKLTEYAKCDLVPAADRVLIKGSADISENVLRSLKAQSKSIEDEINSMSPGAGLKIDPDGKSKFLPTSKGRLYIALLPIVFEGKYQSQRRA